jgi:hypothetical protein
MGFCDFATFRLDNLDLFYGAPVIEARPILKYFFQAAQDDQSAGLFHSPVHGNAVTLDDDAE